MESTREQDAAAERLSLEYDSVRVGPAAPRGAGALRAECYDGGRLVAVFIINAAGDTRGE